MKEAFLSLLSNFWQPTEVPMTPCILHYLGGDALKTLHRTVLHNCHPLEIPLATLQAAQMLRSPIQYSVGFVALQTFFSPTR